MMGNPANRSIEDATQWRKTIIQNVVVSSVEKQKQPLFGQHDMPFNKSIGDSSRYATKKLSIDEESTFANSNATNIKRAKAVKAKGGVPAIKNYQEYRFKDYLKNC